MRSRYGVLIAGLFVVLSVTPAAAVIVPEDREFVVTRTRDSQQQNPVAAFGPGGISLLVWDDSRYGVRGQLFDAQGAKVGGVLELAPNHLPPIPGEGPATFCLEPAVTFLAGGDFIVAWAQEDGYLRVVPFRQSFDVATRRVMARRFSIAGEAAGPALPISQSAADRQSRPELLTLPGGGRVLAAWRSDGAGGTALVARELSRLGRPLGADFRLSRAGEREGQNVALAEGIRSHIVLSWEACCDAGGDLGIFARIYDAAARTYGPVVQVNRDTAGRQRRPALVADGDRGFLALWQSELGRSLTHIYGQFLDLDGQRVGGEFQVSHGEGTVQLAPAIAATPAGGFLAIWRDYVPDAQYTHVLLFGITAVELDQTGSPRSAPLRVNNRRIQKSGHRSLASDGAGTFLIPWETIVGGRQAIGARRLGSE
jgi:hypothetical protein